MFKKFILTVLLSAGLVLPYSSSLTINPHEAHAVQEAQALTIPYVEYGTWTPSSGGTATYTSQVGTWVKVGRQVTVYGRLQINTIGTGSTANILGLPYPISLTQSIYATGAVEFVSLSQSVSSVVAVVGAQGASIVTLYSILSDGASMTTNSVIGSGTSVFFSATYLTD